MKDVHIEDKLCNFIKEFCDDLSSLQLLLFFSRHPNAHFNRSALEHVLVTKKFDTAAALKKLLERKVVVIGNINGVNLYSLTTEEPVRTLAVQLINVDQTQWPVILNHILEAMDTQI